MSPIALMNFMHRDKILPLSVYKTKMSSIICLIPRIVLHETGLTHALSSFLQTYIPAELHAALHQNIAPLLAQFLDSNHFILHSRIAQ